MQTGWERLYRDKPAFLKSPDEKSVPGVTGEAAEWLAERGVRAAGSDTTAFDQIVPGPSFLARPAHTVLLFKHAIHIIELLDLEELAKEGVKEFMFVLAPLKLVGATGSPVRPLAVVDAV
jgi:kynurenine formamidase